MWLPSDVAYARAWKAYEDAKCPGCGQPWEEASSRDAEGSYEATAVRCWGCAERTRASREFARPVDGYATPSTDGLYFLLRKTD